MFRVSSYSRLQAVTYRIFDIQFSTLCKLYLVFENIVNFISKNPLSHGLKMALGRKLKHVAVMIF
jgi:hypothetical protein